MTGADGVRDLATRTADTRAMLEREVDCWMATADPATGQPWLVPLSYVWDGRALLLATPGGSLTGRNPPRPAGSGWASARRAMS